MAHEQTPLLGEGDRRPSSKADISKILAGLVGVFLASADKSILLATQGEIASSLHSPASASLLLVIYNVGFCIALPVYGFLSDIYGCRQFLLSAYGLFAVGCLISGIAETLWPFVLGRLISGMGGAGMTDLLSVLVNEMFDITQVASVRSYIIAAGIVGQGCGGPLGALVADMVGWRWSLIGQTPIAVLCLALAQWQFSASPTIESRSNKGLSLWNFDYFGVASFFILVTSFILATTEGGISYLTSQTPALLAVSSAFLVIFVLIERFGTRYPIIPPSVVCSPGLSGIFCGQIVYFATVTTILNNLPPYFYRIDHLSNSAIAIRIWPAALGLISGSIVAGKTLSRDLQPRKISLIAIGITTLSLTLMVIRWLHGIRPLEVLYCFPWGVGGGILLSAQFIDLTIRAPTEQLASAIAVYHLSQQVGQIVGTSVSAAALQQLFRLRVNAGLGDMPGKRELIDHIVHDYNFTTTLPSTIQTVVQKGYIEAYRLVPASALVLSVIVGGIVLFPKEEKVEL
ncbi:MFS general substrate transporter [Aspergillus saccharolyticus JOP 1030-1]|uniref:MFS general substrate transporter n=1 Tax=Aspergillus saccharolyticus JOP 1030-1 TaxID=1450539 RepID=A0A318Z6W8_9EURO|nr:MFS general substrate transporter [Aspergillus saccharolyticus JOP 1030-1]PYH43055.1 MFS general substrate transporter [Aspergillus saccharolyticus JOP 1030-1]